MLTLIFGEKKLFATAVSSENITCTYRFRVCGNYPHAVRYPVTFTSKRPGRDPYNLVPIGLPLKIHFC